MVEQIQILVQQIFGKMSIDELELDEIRDFTTQYPYFAPGQFLLLEKLKRTDHAEYGSQLQKAVLYYNDPVSFEFFIQNKLNALTEEPSWATSRSLAKPIQEQAEVGPEVDSETEQTSPSLQNIEVDEREINVDGIEVDEVLLVDTEAPESHLSNTSEAVETFPDDEASEVNEVPETVDNSSGANEAERIFESVMPQIKVSDTVEELSFEPFHTVDYFASQGIKLNAEEQPRDRFGKQLKSFTEWLKTMKRSPAPEQGKLQDNGLDRKVESMAESSVNEQEVLTEAMAEVWLKQGNKHRAIEIYEKLGLTNPDKNSYFAGLIENINRS